MPRKSRKKQSQFYVVANWKMNKTIREALEYTENLPEFLDDFSVNVWLTVPFISIKPVREKFSKKFEIGAQNMNDASEGAFTGEISGEMLKEAGASFVLLGHSERRKIFNEEDEFINRKVLRSLSSSLKPVLCVGETFEERENDETKVVLERQISEGLKGVDDISNCLIAYEPVWAIGTGKVATPEIVLDTHGMIRSTIASLYDEAAAQSISILYGGSVSSKNAEQLSRIEGVNGFLIGTASLDPESFSKIVTLSDNIVQK